VTAQHARPRRAFSFSESMTDGITTHIDGPNEMDETFSKLGDKERVKRIIRKALRAGAKPKSRLAVHCGRAWKTSLLRRSRAILLRRRGVSALDIGICCRKGQFCADDRAAA
jgi:hypothetical protein